MIIPFGDSGNMISEAKKQLPKSFANPSILVTYQNKKGKKFKTNKLLHSILIID